MDLTETEKHKLSYGVGMNHTQGYCGINNACLTILQLYLRGKFPQPGNGLSLTGNLSLWYCSWSCTFTHKPTPKRVVYETKFEKRELASENGISVTTISHKCPSNHATEMLERRRAILNLIWTSLQSTIIMCPKYTVKSIPGCKKNSCLWWFQWFLHQLRIRDRIHLCWHMKKWRTLRWNLKRRTNIE